MDGFQPLFAYFGPETMLPLASVFAAIGGAVLMFWRNVKLIVGRIFGRKPQVRPVRVPRPHVAINGNEPADAAQTAEPVAAQTATRGD